jgi:hypothetical protein
LVTISGTTTTEDNTDVEVAVFEGTVALVIVALTLVALEAAVLRAADR